MKLYTKCNNCKRKTYLIGIVAGNRVSFAQQIHKKKVGVQCDGCNTFEVHSVNNVYAEDQASIIGPAILVMGFFSAIFIGAIGVFIGGLAAVLIDLEWKSLEATCVRKFNTSVIM